jgi:hypothetical protein
MRLAKTGLKSGFSDISLPTRRLPFTDAVTRLRLFGIWGSNPLVGRPDQSQDHDSLSHLQQSQHIEISLDYATASIRTINTRLVATNQRAWSRPTGESHSLFSQHGCLILARLRCVCHSRSPGDIDLGPASLTTLPTPPYDSWLPAAPCLSRACVALQHHHPGSHRSRLDRECRRRGSKARRMVARKSCVCHLEDHILVDICVDLVHLAADGRVLRFGLPRHKRTDLAFTPK